MSTSPTPLSPPAKPESGNTMKLTAQPSAASSATPATSDLPPLLDLPALDVMGVPSTKAKDKDGQEKELFIAYALKAGTRLVFQEGRIDSETLTHSQAMWLISKYPHIARGVIVRGQWPKEHSYWQGMPVR